MNGRETKESSMALNPMWKLFYAGGPLPAEPDSIRETPDFLMCGGEKILPVETSLKEMTNLNDVLNLEPELGREAILVREEIRSEEKTVYMGTFADWWCSLHVNGELADTTFPEGNAGAIFGHFNHLFPVHLKKGRNLLVFRVRSGLVAWWAACGEAPFFPAAGPHDTKDFSRRSIINFVLPRVIRVKRGPYLCRMTETSVCVSFQTDGMMAAAVEYRKKGKDAWTRIVDAVDTLPNYALDSHMVTLEDLKPDTEYEYRVVLFADFKSKGVSSPPDGPFQSFRTFSRNAGPYTAFATGDTQTDYPRRESLLERLRDSVREKRISLSVHLGDANSNCDNFERDVLIPLELFPKAPVVFAVGNHEHCGLESGELNRYFFPDGKSYHAFRHGAAFWFILNTGNDFCNDYGDLNTPLMEAQKRWIARVAETEGCRSAAWRIVIAHHAPAFRTVPGRPGRPSLDRHAKILTTELLRHCKIHLYIAGHTHKYLRTLPGTNQFFALPPPGPVDYEAEELIALDESNDFTIVVPRIEEDYFSAILPTVEEKEIRVETVGSDGKMLDVFRILRDGRIETVFTAPDLVMYEHKNSQRTVLPSKNSEKEIE